MNKFLVSIVLFLSLVPVASWADDKWRPLISDNQYFNNYPDPLRNMERNSGSVRYQLNKNKEKTNYYLEYDNKHNATMIRVRIKW